MRCHDVVSRLDAYVDCSLAGVETAAVGDHVAHCSSCREELDELRHLLERVAALPSSIEPEHDLWSAIAARGPARRQWRPSWAQALGAAAALVLAAAVVIGLVASQRDEPVRVTEVPEPVAPVAAAALEHGQSELDKARSQLRALFEERRDSLSPETRLVLAGSLKVIEASIQGLRSAVQASPENPRLVRMLVAAYQREIDLLRHAAQLPEGA